MSMSLTMLIAEDWECGEIINETGHLKSEYRPERVSITIKRSTSYQNAARTCVNMEMSGRGRHCNN